MKERLIEFINYLKITNADFERNANLSNGFINNIGDSIRESTLKKISNAYPNLNIDWLKTNHGNMINGIKNEFYESEKNQNSTLTIQQSDFSSFLNLQVGYQNLLLVSQNQLIESQKQINILLEIIKNK